MRKSADENKLSDAITGAYFEISALAVEMQEALPVRDMRGDLHLFSARANSLELLDRPVQNS